MDKEKIERYMKLTGLKKALIRDNGRYYYVHFKGGLTAWENQPYEDIVIEEVPPPVELV